jgi:hypothetical protein
MAIPQRSHVHWSGRDPHYPAVLMSDEAYEFIADRVMPFVVCAALLGIAGLITWMVG